MQAGNATEGASIFQHQEAREQIGWYAAQWLWGYKSWVRARHCWCQLPNAHKSLRASANERTSGELCSDPRSRKFGSMLSLNSNDRKSNANCVFWICKGFVCSIHVCAVNASCRMWVHSRSVSVIQGPGTIGNRREKPGTTTNSTRIRVDQRLSHRDKQCRKVFSAEMASGTITIIITMIYIITTNVILTM